MNWPVTNAPLVADMSFKRYSGAQLRAAGFAGAVGYVSPDATKNLPKALLADWLAHDLLVALVYEADQFWMAGGQPSGIAAGKLAAAQAKAIGYDPNCVIFAAADFNITSQATMNAVLACYSGFKDQLKTGGIYGQLGLLARAPVNGTWLWQTNASSWSGNQIYPRAHLLQYYNDPRAKGMVVDVNEVRRPPLSSFMGYKAPPIPKPPAPKPPTETDELMPNMVIYTVDRAMADAPPATDWPGEFVLYPNTGIFDHIEQALGAGAAHVDNVAALTKGGAVNGGMITYPQYLKFQAVSDAVLGKVSANG